MLVSFANQARSKALDRPGDLLQVLRPLEIRAEDAARVRQDIGNHRYATATKFVIRHRGGWVVRRFDQELAFDVGDVGFIDYASSAAGMRTSQSTVRTSAALTGSLRLSSDESAQRRDHRGLGRLQ